MAGKIVLAYVCTIQTWYGDDTHPCQCITVYFIWYQLYSTVNPYFFYFYRILNCSSKWTDDLKNQIDELITNYIKHPTQIEETNSIITHISEMQCVSKKDMVNIFNSISNYHWIDYPRFKNGKVVKDNLTRYSSHLLWFPDDRDRRNHLPTSPRLHFLQFYYFEQ